MSQAPTDDPFWAEIVPHFRHMTPGELLRYPGQTHGWVFTSAVCEPRLYMAWLTQRFNTLGGQVRRCAGVAAA